MKKTVQEAAPRARLTRVKRVDIQVSILTASIVFISVACVFGFNYAVTYGDMIGTLRERCTSIYTHVEKDFDKSTFYSINTREDMGREEYRDMKLFLENVKSASGVRYLYTAKQTESGDYIYIVDGLACDSEDFRYPGDAIEEEIVCELDKALQDQILFPDQIKQTTWGDIFVSYLPIHDGGRVVGVIGIEFDAARQYRAFRLLRVVTPLIILVMCIAATRIAVILFRRISNPGFKDFANTDYLTGLKNRNAFEIDMHNLDAGRARESAAVVSVDLNGLKLVNDTQGHEAGDEYIRAAAVLLGACVQEGQVLYRVGGDEFAVIAADMDDGRASALVGRIREAVRGGAGGRPVTLAVGCALSTPQDRSIFDVYRRADGKMYEDKKEQKRGGNAGANAERPPVPSSGGSGGENAFRSRMETREGTGEFYGREGK